MTSILQRDHRSVRGTIRYTSNKPDRLGQERGREYFMINVHGDGRRTCIAHCEIDDRPSVMRDITYSLDENWYPDGLLRAPRRQRPLHGQRLVPVRTGLRRMRDLDRHRGARHAADGDRTAAAQLPEPRDPVRCLAPAALRPQRSARACRPSTSCCCRRRTTAAPPARCCSGPACASTSSARRRWRWRPAPSTRCTSGSSRRPDCRSSIRPTTSGARRTTTSSS